MSHDTQQTAAGGQSQGTRESGHGLTETLRRPLRIVWSPVRRASRAIRRGLEAVAPLADAVWRMPLVVGATAMLIGGALLATGHQPLSGTVVTGGFVLALLGVPLGLLALLAPKPSAGQPMPGDEELEAAMTSWSQESVTN
jgi:hypothetical protein